MKTHTCGNPWLPWVFARCLHKPCRDAGGTTGNGSGASGSGSGAGSGKGSGASGSGSGSGDASEKAEAWKAINNMIDKLG